MAIFADYKRINYTVSETETVQEEVIYPDDLEENDPNYTKRGQTIIETFPLVTSSEEIFKSVYIVISHYTFYKFQKNIDGQYLFDIQFRIYNDKKSYLTDENTYLFEGDALGEFKTILTSDDLRIKGYEALKNLPYIDNIIND